MRFHSRLNLGVWFLAIAGIPALLCGMPAGSCPAPPLRSAASFAVLGRTVMNAGPSIVTGNLGVSSGAPTGFPPGHVNIGTTFHSDSTVQQAQNDATSAYGALTSCGSCISLSNPNLGGMTLGPGVYCSSSPLTLTGTLTLDAHDDPNAVWIFRTTGTLTADANASVLVTRSGWNGNVFWQAAGPVTLNASTTFVGNVLTPADITLRTGASVSGRLLAGGAVTLESNNVSLCCDPITLSPATLPNGAACTPYSNTTFSASGGTAPYSFNVASGALPDGLTLIGGVLSGTPAKKGTFNIAVTATDFHGCSGTRLYVIDIGCPADPPIVLPPANACDVYCQKITSSCGTGPLTSSDLPAGLTLSPEGMLCGTPATPGDYVFTVTDSSTGCSRRYALQVICNIMISPATLPNATACGPYSETLKGSCGTARYTFSAPEGSLPAGLFLSPDGLVYGTPATPGTSTFPVTVTDARSCTVSRSYTIVVNPQIATAPPALPNGVVCTPYSQPITPSCGTPPYTCSIAPGGSLPPGLILNNCVISGTPAVGGTFRFTIKAGDSGGSSASKPYTIVITCPAIPVEPPVLPPATTCQFYNQPLTRSCGTGPYVFIVTKGTLPNGLTLSSGGVLSGTATTAGDYSFTVTAVDPVSGCPASTDYVLPVTGGVMLTPATLPGGWPGVPYSEVITASGGTAPYTSVLTGTLPPGLFFTTTQTTATISGTPTTVGCFPFTVTVTDATGPPGCSTSVTYTICIATGGPTLSGWGMVVLSMLLVGAGLVMVRQ